jgi:MshEN domain
VDRSGDQESERKGVMSSNPPTEGMFFVDQPAQPPAQAPPPAPEPAAQPVAPPEQAPAPEPAQGESMRDVPLGTLIFRAGLLAEEQLEDALQEGMRSGKRLGEVLLERGLLHERDLGRLLAGQKGLPFVELSGVSPDPTAVPLIPEEKARMQNALAIAFEKGMPVVAVADPTNDLVMENLRRVLGCEPRLVVAAHGDLHRKIEEAYAPVTMSVSPEPVAAPEEPAAVAPPPPPEPALVASPEPVAATPAPEPLATPPVVEVPPIQAQPLVQPVEQPAPAPPSEPAVVAPPAAETPPMIQPLSVELPLAREAALSPLEPVKPADAEPVVEAAPVAPEIPAPVEPQPAAEVSANGTAAEEAHHFVVLRLSEGEQLEIGTFGSTEEAQGFAQEVVRQIAAAEGEATWPFFAGRFLRPETIVSVDLIAEAAERWTGSSAHARWAAS